METNYQQSHFTNEQYHLHQELLTDSSSRCRRCRKYQSPYDGSPWNRWALFARIQEIARHSKFEDGHRLIRRHRSAFQSIAFLCQFALWCNRWKALLRVRRREVKTWLKCWPQVHHDLER